MNDKTSKKLENASKDKHSNFESQSGDTTLMILEWLGQKKSNEINCVKIYEFADTGRGMMATRDIKPGDVIIRVLSSFFIDTRTISRSNIMDIITMSLLKPTAVEALCLFLLWERCKGSCSEWQHYIKLLPPSFNLPLFWSEHEIMFLPKTAQLDVKTQKLKVHKSFDKVKKILDAYLTEKLSRIKPSLNSTKKNNFKNSTTLKYVSDLSSKLTLPLFLWAWTVVNSRGAYMRHPLMTWLDASEEDKVVLVPFLDMFNHSVDAQVEAGYDDESSSYVIKSLCAFEKGSQVFINYGAHDSATLLLDYGFICPDNINDCIYFTLDDLVNEARRLNIEQIDEKVFTIRAHQFDRNLWFCMEGLSWNMEQALLLLTSQATNNSLLRKYSGINSEWNQQARQLVACLIDNTMNNLSHTHNFEGLQDSACLQLLEELGKVYTKILECVRSQMEM